MLFRGLPGSSLLLGSVTLLAALVSSSAPTECYLLDGNPMNAYRCDNSTTGHSSCCAIGGTCYSNGVCAQINGLVQDYLRVGCTDPTWDDPACLKQCTNYAPHSIAGIRFCEGTITTTDQYCCDNGTSGVGSFKCCGTPSSIFTIDPIAIEVGIIPIKAVASSSSSSSSSISSSTSSSTLSTSTSSVAATNTVNTAASETSSSASVTSISSETSVKAAAIGAGVGIPIGIVALAALGYFIFRKQKASRAAHHAQMMQSNSSSAYPPFPYGARGNREAGGYTSVAPGASSSYHTAESAASTMHNYSAASPNSYTQAERVYNGGYTEYARPMVMPMATPMTAGHTPMDFPGAYKSYFEPKISYTVPSSRAIGSPQELYTAPQTPHSGQSPTPTGYPQELHSASKGRIFEIGPSR